VAPAPSKPVATSAAKRPTNGLSEKKSEKTVEFSLNNPAARAVAVAGSFNNWDFKRTPMQKSDGGAWKAKVAVPPGRHEYRFVVDGQWTSDPNARESVDNAYGSNNSVVTVR
jgi:1,4-alpha-glucan branching enzyme